MSNIQIEESNVVAHFEGTDIVHARRFTLKVSLASIEAVSVGIPAVAHKEPAMLWGKYTSDELLIGTEDAAEGHRECFYEVRHPAWAITLKLSRGRFEYVVLEPSNATPEVIVGRIQEAIGHKLPESPLPPGLMPEASDASSTPER